MNVLEKWRKRGQTFTITTDGQLQPARKWHNAEEAAQAKAEKDDIKQALLDQWEKVMVACSLAWSEKNGYEAIVRWGTLTLRVQPGIDHCAFPGHEDRPQYQDLAVCEECALFSKEDPTIIDFHTATTLKRAPDKVVPISSRRRTN